MVRAIDMKTRIGEKCARLTLVGVTEDGKRYICKCDCGNELERGWSKLKNAPYASCGCWRKEFSSKIEVGEYLIGKTSGFLTVIDYDVITDTRHMQIITKCKCGDERIVLLTQFINGTVTSCGKKEHRAEMLSEGAKKNFPTAGESRTRLWKCWSGMIDRCTNPKHSSYKNYGGKGITVCDEWNHVDAFPIFKEWAIANGYDDSLTIDRVNVEGNYEPSNCRWADVDTQQNNKRNTTIVNFKGEDINLHQYCKRRNLKTQTIYKRIFERDWSVEDALTKDLDTVGPQDISYYWKNKLEREQEASNQNT